MRETRLARPRAAGRRRRSPRLDAVWCGARNGGTVTSGRPGGSSPATEWMRVTSSASSAVERRQDPRQAAGQHRLPRPRRAGEQEVVAPGGRELERAARTLLAAHVGEVGRRPGAAPFGAGGGRRRRQPSPRRYATASARWRTGTGSIPASAASGADSAAHSSRPSPPAALPRPPRATPPTGRNRPSSASSPTAAWPPSPRADLLRSRQHRERDRQVEARALLPQLRRREVDRDPVPAATQLGRGDAAADALLRLLAGAVG